MITDFIISLMLKFIPANDVGIVAVIIVGISWLIITIDHVLAATSKVKANSTWQGIVGIAGFLFKKEEKVLESQRIVSTTVPIPGPGPDPATPGEKVQNFGAATGDKPGSPGAASG